MSVHSLSRQAFTGAGDWWRHSSMLCISDVRNTFGSQSATVKWTKVPTALTGSTETDILHPMSLT